MALSGADRTGTHKESSLFRKEREHIILTGAFVLYLTS